MLCVCVCSTYTRCSAQVIRGLQCWWCLALIFYFSFSYVSSSEHKHKKVSIKRQSRDSRQALFLWIHLYLYHISSLLFRLFYLLLFTFAYGIWRFFHSLSRLFNKRRKWYRCIYHIFWQENFRLSIELHT